ncbi:MAG: hypothetical protein U0K19_05025 [Bifidobacteriaceae bacterium]|nr:hypothetical protein [Bifidobacteriaceae bacterium]
MAYSKSTKLWILQNKKSRGIELTPEELGWEVELRAPVEGSPKKERKPRATLSEHDKKKRRAKRAVEALAAAKDKPKWMQQWIDWEDRTIPVGKRRVAYVRYMTIVRGMSLRKAKALSVKIIN